MPDGQEIGSISAGSGNTGMGIRTCRRGRVFGGRVGFNEHVSKTDSSRCADDSCV